MTSHAHALIRFWLSVGFFGCAILFVLCLVPSPPQPAHIPNVDKIEHFTAYLVLGAWFAGLLAPHYARVFVGLFAFGVFIEAVQWLSGYRDAEFGDVIADSAGALVGIGLAHFGAMRWLDAIDRRVAARKKRAE